MSDLISRQDAIEAIANIGFVDEDDGRCHDQAENLEYAEQVLEDVPSAEKTGRWILAKDQSKEDTENGNYRYVCSECDHSDIHAKTQEVPYCWHCGARMAGDTE